MAESYGVLFKEPEKASPAAAAGIEQDDVVTSINGSPLQHARDFSSIISSMAPGTTVSLTTWRGGEWFQRTVVVGSSECPDPTAQLPSTR